MNILPGQYHATRRGVVLENGTFLPVAAALDLTDGHLVQIGIRPEHARLVPPGQGLFDARVDMIEELGAQRLCNLMFEDIPFCLLTDDRPDLAAGAAVGVQFPSDRAHVFGSADGKRIDPVRKDARAPVAVPAV